MSEVETTPEQRHEANKALREALAWAHFKLQVITSLPEDFNMHQRALQGLEAVCLTLQKEIEKVEPPVKPEPKEQVPAKPYIIDVPAPKEAASV